MTTQKTSLVIITPMSGDDGLHLPPYSARGLTQTLELISGAQNDNALGVTIRETINGELVNLFPTQFRKYQSIITCRDFQTPCLDAAYIGQLVTVECSAELSYPTGGTPQRPEVSGSSRDADGFTFYRPILVMMLLGMRSNFDEFNAEYAWQLDLREWKIPTLSP